MERNRALKVDIEEVARMKLLEQDISWKMRMLQRKYGKENIEREVMESGFYIILKEELEKLSHS